MHILRADQCKSRYKFAHLHKYLCRGCFRWIGKNAKKLKRTMFQQSAANLNFFSYRLHNETLDKKINSTHDCQDYYNSLGVTISRNFTTSALLRIYSKRMTVINQPLCQPSPQAFSAGANLRVLSITARSPKVWPHLINTHSFMQTLTNQKSRTVSSWLLIGLNLHETVNVNTLKAITLFSSLL